MGIDSQKIHSSWASNRATGCYTVSHARTNFMHLGTSGSRKRGCFASQIRETTSSLLSNDENACPFSALRETQLGTSDFAKNTQCEPRATEFKRVTNKSWVSRDKVKRARIIGYTHLLSMCKFIDCEHIWRLMLGASIEAHCDTGGYCILKLWANIFLYFSFSFFCASRTVSSFIR